MTIIKTTSQNHDFIARVQRRLKELNNLIDEQRNAKTISLYNKYQNSIERFLVWFRENDVIIDTNINKQYVLVEIREEQEEDFAGDRIAEKALELLSNKEISRPAKDAYQMVLRIVVEHGPGNGGMTNCYVKEVVQALKKLDYIE